MDAGSFSLSVGAIFAIAALAAVLCGLIAGSIATNKGLSFGLYFLIGLVAGVIGIVVAAVVPGPAQERAVLGPPPQFAGWYPDPWGEAVYRYHDGQQWTPHKSNGRGTA